MLTTPPCRQRPAAPPIRKELHIDLSVSQILQILSVNAFEQVPLAELIANTQSQDESSYPPNQLMLWG